MRQYETDVTTNHKKIPENTRAGLVRALRLHYAGESINKSFAADDTPSKAHYYMLKESSPEEMDAIEEEARQLALRDLRKTLTSLDAQMLNRSVEARDRASEAVLASIDQLRAIALGATFTVDVPREDGSVRKKTVVSTPAAQINAAELLWKIAREGFTTLETTEKRSLVDERAFSQQPQPPKSSLRSLGVPIDFSEVSATLPNGRTVTITRSQEGEIIDAETDDDAETAST